MARRVRTAERFLSGRKIVVDISGYYGNPFCGLSVVSDYHVVGAFVEPGI